MVKMPKMVRHRTKFTKESTCLACPQQDTMNAKVQQHIPCAEIPVTLRSPNKIDQKMLFWEKRPYILATMENAKFPYETTHTDTDSHIPAKFCGNP